MATVVRELSVCVDCLLMHCNGEVPGDWDCEPLGLVKGESLAMACGGGEDGHDDCGFTWSQPCDGCGSTLGGDRHRMVVFGK